MKRLMIRAAVAALAAAALAGCATTPQYATRSGYAAPPPLDQATPQYPTRPRAAPPAPAAAPASADEQAAARPSTPVESRALLTRVSVSSAELAAADPPPAQPAAGAPPQVEERASELQRMPAAPAAAPPAYTPAYVPPAPAPPPRAARPAPARYIAAGRVVDGSGILRNYTVRKGEHIDAIARNLGTTRKVLVEENRLKAPYHIRPGQVLRVPVDKAYAVMAGDTLGAVARRFGVSVGELAGINHLSTRAALKPGQKLGLPDGFRDRGPIKLTPTQVAEAPPPSRLAQATPAPYVPPPSRPAQTYAPAPYVPPAPPPVSRPYATTPYVPPVQTASPPPSRPYAMAPSQPAYRPAPPPPGAARPPMIDTSPTPSESEIASAARGRFLWPVRGEIISAFGVKGVGRRNDGLDIRAPQGTLVRSAAGGEVVYAGDQVPGFGNLVLVKHTDGWVTAYAHLDRVAVQMRQQVAQGQELGQVGASGGVPEPQLHFEVRYAPTPADKAKPVDPALVLPRL